MIMNDRQTQLLAEIAKEYVKSAEPVGSKLLVEKYHKDLSSATIRNDMAALEEEGLIEQPHTSAGRILTEKGFRELLAVIDFEHGAPEREQVVLQEYLKDAATSAECVKQLARNTAQLANNAVVVAFKPNDVYYTGLSMLFGQPEFAEQAAVCSLSEIVDHLDEVMYRLSGILTEPIEVRLGKDNPFGQVCGLVVASFPNQRIFGIVGPLRMDYQANIGRVNFVRALLKD